MAVSQGQERMTSLVEVLFGRRPILSFFKFIRLGNCGVLAVVPNWDTA